VTSPGQTQQAREDAQQAREGRRPAPDHDFYVHNVLRLDHRHQDEPPLSAALLLTPEYRERLTTGRSFHPPFSAEFPAQRLVTAYEWSDLVLNPATRDDIDDVVTWARHQATIMDDWGLKRRLKAGFRTLFYGPPCTGKTMTASLLGTEAEVWNIAGFSSAVYGRRQWRRRRGLMVSWSPRKRPDAERANRQPLYATEAAGGGPPRPSCPASWPCGVDFPQRPASAGHMRS